MGDEASRRKHVTLISGDAGTRGSAAGPWLLQIVARVSLFFLVFFFFLVVVCCRGKRAPTYPCARRSRLSAVQKAPFRRGDAAPSPNWRGFSNSRGDKRGLQARVNYRGFRKISRAISVRSRPTRTPFDFRFFFCTCTVKIVSSVAW